MKYRVKIQEAGDTGARYLDASGDCARAAAVAALNWAQDTRGYGWDGTVTVDGTVFSVVRLGAGQCIVGDIVAPLPAV